MTIKYRCADISLCQATESVLALLRYANRIIALYVDTTFLEHELYPAVTPMQVASRSWIFVHFPFGEIILS